MFSNLFNKKKEKPKKIISFDGGGVRVIAGIVFLKKLEAESGRKISDIFLPLSASSFFKKTIPAITRTPPPSNEIIFLGFSFFY